MIFQRIFSTFFILCLVWSDFILAQNSNTSFCDIISVSGTGSAFGVPDTALASISVSSSSNLSSTALNQLNLRTKQLLDIFNLYNIPLTNIQTTALSLYPEYNYTNGKKSLVSQKAGQVFSLKINGFGNSSIIGSLVDAISSVNDTKVTRLAFDISNKTDLIRVASINAWNDAYNKAYQYASLAQVSLGRAFRIKIPSQPPYVNRVYYDLVTSDADITVGNFGISTSIDVDFLVNS